MLDASRARALAACGFALALLATSPPSPAATKRGVSDATLAAAARSARVADVDYARGECGDERTVEAWLDDAVGDTARITWRGGACELANPDNPIDSGSDWCGGATIVPKADPKHPASIEIYFEKPVDGKPGKAYAFRAENHDIDGLDYKRDTRSFEIGYGQRFVDGYTIPEDDCD
ncbi:hypothetical protein [Dokdonella sp.]|uniref:hypothetical protein n=1 Tax=Dokdonella sp. TaxID=2291710 RepID=UPI002F3E875F